METNFKRSISVGLVLVLIITLVPLTAFATTSIYNLQGTINKPIVNTNSAASFQFALTTPVVVGDEIIVDFPAGFTIPASIPILEASISLNGVGVSNGISGINISNNLVNLELATNISVSDAVYVSFTEGANIITPQVAGGYNIQLSTTKDSTPLGVNVDIKSNVMEPAVSVYSSHIKKLAAYEIVFVTGDTSASIIDGSLGDTVSINFPNDTILPATIANSNIKVNGEVLNQGSVLINTSGGNKTITLTLPSTLKILRNSYVQIEIAKEAGIKNPSIASSQYFLQVWTSKDTLPVNSAYYAIIDSVITVPEVTVSPNIVGQKGAYFIKFRTSSEGDLVGNTDRIYLLFPIDSTVPATIAKGNVLINNIPLTYDPIITNDPVVTNDALGRYRMEILVPTTISVGAEVNIQINPNANILHPSTEGSYSITAWTSQDMVWNQSAEYTVAEAVNGVAVWIGPDIAGQIGQYSVALENGSKLLDIGDTITIRFPAGTVLTKSNIVDYIYLDGQKNTGAVSVSQTALTITVTLTKQINPSQVLNILFTQEAGIENPLKQGNYQLQIKTSKDTAYQYSNIYSVQGNHITNLNTQLSNNGTGLSGEYLIQFTVSSLGGLLGSLDTITIIFPEGTTIPSGGFNYTNIKINDKPLDKSVVVFPSNRLIRLTIPKDVNIYQNSNVKIDILSTANIKNPTNIGNYSLTAYTSRDPVAMESNSYSIGMQTTSATVSVSPNTYLTPAQYAIGFYTSNIGGLSGASNDYVEVLFPVGTSVPASIAYNYVTINGKTAKNIIVNQQSVKIYLPIGLDIAVNGYVGVVIGASGGIRNPSGYSYNLKVRTSKDTSYVLSQGYITYGNAPTTSNPGTTTPTNSSRATVELDTYLAGEFAQYTIKYKTSSTGALRAGMDEISVVFNPKVEIPDYISKELIKVNGQQVNTGWVRRFNQSIIFHLPTTVNVGNNEEIIITIDKKAEIRNPKDAGSYLFYVKTSMDTNAAEDYYSIEGETVSTRFMVTTQTNSNSQIVKYTLKYTTSLLGTLKGGYDWINLSLPIAFTQGQILDNTKIRLNGYLLDKDMIQVSGKNLSFILPPQINIAANTEVEIIIEDEKYIIMPNMDGTFMLYISTSKDSNLLASNSLQAVKYDDGGRIIEDSGANQGNDDDQNDQSPGSNQGSGGSSSGVNIKLYLDKLEATVNGEKYNLDSPPTVVNGITMIPLRFITEVLGGDVDYRPDQKRIIIIYNGKYLIFTIDSNMVYTADDVITLPQAPKAISGRTLVPLRFTAEWMNLYLDYNSTDRSITLKK